MRVKTVVVFFAAIALSLLAAAHRFGDSGHAIGLLSAQGGRVRHAVHLAPGKRQYLLIVTGTVLPPFHGDVRVEVEGPPEMDYEVHSPGPVIDLGLRKGPSFHDQVLKHLAPKDRFALWIVLRPRSAVWTKGAHAAALRNTVTFRDMKTGKPVLQVPVVYHPEERRHGGED